MKYLHVIWAATIMILLAVATTHNHLHEIGCKLEIEKHCGWHWF